MKLAYSKFAIAAVAVVWGLGMFAAGWSLARTTDKPQVEVLLASGRTVLDQPVAYPAETPAKVTAALITMQPGQSTGWHRHEAPLFAYILEGEVTVDYGASGRRVYKTGEAFLEAVGTAHDGTSTGNGPARLLAVFSGAEGVANTVAAGGPDR